MNLAAISDGIVTAFVSLAVGAIVIATVFNLDVASNSSLVDSVQTEVTDGLVQVVGLMVLLIIIFVLGVLRTRA